MSIIPEFNKTEIDAIAADMPPVYCQLSETTLQLCLHLLTRQPESAAFWSLAGADFADVLTEYVHLAQKELIDAMNPIAKDVIFVPYKDVTETNVQDAIEQLEDLKADESDLGDVSIALADHEADTTNPHGVTAAQIGVEAGATADQTASEILTAIKTVDGSGSGLDADTLDTLQSSQFLRSDAENAWVRIDAGELDDYLRSTGDTDTYIQFHASDQWRVVTGGAERFEVNNSYVTVNSATLRVGDNEVWHAGNSKVLISRTKTRLTSDFSTTSTAYSTVLSHTSQSITSGQRMVVRIFSGIYILGNSGHFVQSAYPRILVDSGTAYNNYCDSLYHVGDTTNSVKGIVLAEFEITSTGTHSIALQLAARFAGDVVRVSPASYSGYETQIITELWSS